MGPAGESPIPIPPATDSTFLVQLLLIGVILPLAFFFLLQAEQDLGPALLLRYTDTRVTDGRVVAVAPASATLEYAGVIKALDITPDASRRLQGQPRVAVRYTTRDPRVAVLEGEVLPVANGLGFLAAGLAFLVAALAAGWVVWRTEGR